MRTPPEWHTEARQLYFQKGWCVAAIADRFEKSRAAVRYVVVPGEKDKVRDRVRLKRARRRANGAPP